MNFGAFFQRKIGSGYLYAMILLALATLLGSLLRSFVVPTNLVMLYLLAVVIIATRWGYGPAVSSSAVSVIIFNFFFVPHQYTLHVADAQYLLTFAGLFVVGVVIADLTDRVRRQADAAHRRESQTAELYALSRDLVATVNLDRIVEAVVRHISDTVQADVAILLYENKQLTLYTKTPLFEFSSDDQIVAQWVFENAQPAGCGASNWEESDTIFVPLMTVQEKIGVLALHMDQQLARHVEYRRLVDAFCNQAALAIEAARLVQEAHQAQLLREREKLHTAVLNSISHDLRTPLVSIAGTLSALRDESSNYPERARQELLDGAWLETQRLNRIVANLLDMTRLKTGMIQLKQDWCDIQELIAISRSQLVERLEKRPLQIEIAPDVPLICIDLTLMVQVLINLLDNALKYSAEGSPLDIGVYRQNTQLVIEVADRGDGIPEEDLPHIFETFYRAHRTGGIGGTGLGLSICEGIVMAHQGIIEAENRTAGGALFRICLPITASPIAE